MAKASQEQTRALVKTPLHLRLTNEDWVDTFKTLTRAELGVFYWIRTKDPFGDKELDINCGDLGIELAIHKSSVSRALQSLASKLLIELELISARVKQKISNRKLTLLCEEETTGIASTPVQSAVAPVQSAVAPVQSAVAPVQSAVAPVQQQMHQRNNQPPENTPDNSSEVPHTIQTKKTELDTTEKEGCVLEKFEQKLNRIGVYRRILSGDQLIDNPKIQAILQLLNHIPPSDAERSIAAFLKYSNQNQIKDVYRTMFSFISNRWEDR